MLVNAEAWIRMSGFKPPISQGNFCQLMVYILLPKLTQISDEKVNGSKHRKIASALPIYTSRLSKCFERCLWNNLCKFNLYALFSILNVSLWKPLCRKFSNISMFCIPFSCLYCPLWRHNWWAVSQFVPSQWETSLQSNVVFHRMGANLESAMQLCVITWRQDCMEVYCLRLSSLLIRYHVNRD